MKYLNGSIYNNNIEPLSNNSNNSFQTSTKNVAEANATFTRVKNMQRKVNNEFKDLKNYKNVFSVNQIQELDNTKHLQKTDAIILDDNCPFPYNSPANLLINTDIQTCANRAFNYGGTYLGVTSKDPEKKEVDCVIMNDPTYKKLRSNPNNKDTTVLWRHPTPKTNQTRTKDTYFWFAPTGQIILKKENKKRYRATVLNRFGPRKNKCNPTLGNKQIKITKASYGANCKVCDGGKPKRVDADNEDIKNIIQDSMLCQQAEKGYNIDKFNYTLDYDKFDPILKKKYKHFGSTNPKLYKCNGRSIEPEFKVSFTCDGNRPVNAFIDSPYETVGAGRTTDEQSTNKNIAILTTKTGSHGDTLTFQCPADDYCDGSPFKLTLEDTGILKWHSSKKENKFESHKLKDIVHTYPPKNNSKQIIPPQIVTAIVDQKKQDKSGHNSNDDLYHIKNVEDYLCKNTDIKQYLGNIKVKHQLQSGEPICHNTVLVSPNRICCATFYNYTIQVHCILVKSLPIQGKSDKLTGITDPQETSMAIYKLHKPKDISNMGHLGYKTGKDVKVYPEDMLSSVCMDNDPMQCWIPIKHHVISHTTDPIELEKYKAELENEKQLNYKKTYLNKLPPGILRMSDLFKSGSPVTPAIFDLDKCNRVEVFKAASRSPVCHIISVDTKLKQLYALSKDNSTYKPDLSASKLFFKNDGLPKYPTLLFKNRGCGTVYVKKPIIKSKMCSKHPVTGININDYANLKNTGSVAPQTKCGTNPEIAKMNCLYKQAEDNLAKAIKYQKCHGKKICKKNKELRQHHAHLKQQVAAKQKQNEKLQQQQQKKGLVADPTNNVTHNTTANQKASASTKDATMHNVNKPADSYDGDNKKISKGQDLTIQSWLADLNKSLNQRHYFFIIYSLFGLTILFVLARMYRNRK